LASIDDRRTEQESTGRAHNDPSAEFLGIRRLIDSNNEQAANYWKSQERTLLVDLYSCLF
jgi:hypothetical protein